MRVKPIAWGLSVAWVGLVCFAGLTAQTTKPPAVKPPAPPASALKKEPAEVSCPAPLGVGVKTKTAFCNVIAGREPTAGVLIKIPPHRGIATLTFDLHNLHLYSEEQVKAKKAFARYTATIGVLTMDNTLVSRAAVMSEFRTASDFVDRVSGGAGPGGVKAVGRLLLQRLVNHAVKTGDGGSARECRWLLMEHGVQHIDHRCTAERQLA